MVLNSKKPATRCQWIDSLKWDMGRRYFDTAIYVMEIIAHKTANNVDSRNYVKFSF